MPVIAFSALYSEGRLKDAGERLLSLPPGMVLTTGQAVSGKVTILLALVEAMATKQGRSVILLSDRPEDYLPFRPLPAHWTEVLVPPNQAAWRQALRSGCSTDALLVVAPLNRDNAPVAMEVAGTRWLFAALDTLVAGLDASYTLRDLGVRYDDFAGNVRCVWSQFLVDALCDACATDAVIAPEELELLFPSSPPSDPLRTETGCVECEGRGTKGKVAISDVTFITDNARPVVRGALVQGVSIDLGNDAHIAARDQAHELLAGGVIGINTYRDAFQRNPLLRTQNALELVRSQSVKLSSLFDTFVRSLWLDLDVLRAVADRTAAGVIVAEEDRRIRFASARARQALLADGELSIVDEQLRAGNPRLRRALTEALARATGDAVAATRLKLKVEGAANSDVFVAPLPTVRGFASGTRRLALIVIGGPARPERLPSGQDLRQYFDLTPAEAKVALLLCAGHVPKAVARQLQVSIPTVRSHLRALLEKTGTSRQTELIQLLSSLPRTGGDDVLGQDTAGAANERPERKSLNNPC